MTEQVQVDIQEGVMNITLNRPDKMNALNLAMYQAMADALVLADQDPAVRAILLTGSATCFTSGNDVSDFLKRDAMQGDNPVQRFMFALFDARKPVIAAVSGPAVGIGTTLLLHCDLVYVSRDAKLQMPFVRLGLCPEFGSSKILTRRLGATRAAQLLLLGELFSGEQAAAWNLANECLGSAEATLEKAREAAKQFVKLPPQAVMDSKALMRAPDREALREVIIEESELFAKRLKSPEAIEALNAFLERRAPDFSNC